MLVRLLGVQAISFSDKDGRAIKGTNIFIGFEQEDVQGLKTEKLFF